VRTGWARKVACIGEQGNQSSILTGEPEENKPLGIRIQNWKNSTKMDLRDLEYTVTEGINGAQVGGPVVS
jgi:hypothetical protein